MKHVRQKNLSCLPRQPLHILNILKGMITISEPAQLSASQHHSSSLIGILDCLPLQILQWPLDLLEFQSSSCISHASLLTKRVVKSLPPCHNLISMHHEYWKLWDWEILSMFIQLLHFMMCFSLKHVFLIQSMVFFYHFWLVNNAAIDVCSKSVLYELFQSIKIRNVLVIFQSSEALSSRDHVRLAEN